MNITRKTSAIFRYCVHCSFKLDAQSNCNKSKMTSSATKKIIVQSSSFGLVVYTCLMEFLWTLIYATRGACFLEGLRDSVWKLACRAMSNKNNKDTCALLLPSRSPQHNSYQLMCLWLILIGTWNLLLFYLVYNECWSSSPKGFLQRTVMLHTSARYQYVSEPVVISLVLCLWMYDVQFECWINSDWTCICVTVLCSNSMWCCWRNSHRLRGWLWYCVLQLFILFLFCIEMRAITC